MPRYRTKLKPKTRKKQRLASIWLALASLGLVLVAAWAFLGNNAQANATIEVTGSPRVKVEKESIDRGQIRLGTPIRDDIRVTNVGDQPLRFVEAPYIEVREGC